MDIIVIDDNISTAKTTSFQEPTNSSMAIKTLRTANMADINVANDISKLREAFSDLADFICIVLLSNNFFDMPFPIAQQLAILEQFNLHVF